MSKEQAHNIMNSLRWRHNGHDDVSNHQPHNCLLNGLFGQRSKKTSKLRVIGLYAGISPGTSEFPAQMTSNGENVSIIWRHHVWRYLWWQLSTSFNYNSVTLGAIPGHCGPGYIWTRICWHLSLIAALQYDISQDWVPIRMPIRVKGRISIRIWNNVFLYERR